MATETLDAVAPRYTTVSLDAFVAADIPRRRWAVEGIWPQGRSGVIGGPPKARKSTLMVELAISLSTGRPFLGHFETHAEHPHDTESPYARVTYIQAENSDAKVRETADEVLCARGLGHMENVEEPTVDEDGEILFEVVGQRFEPLWTPLGNDGWKPDLEILSNPGMDLMLSEDQAWLLGHAAGRDYTFIDPYYLLASADPLSTKEMMRLTHFLNRVRSEAECGILLSHQLTDKHEDGAASSRLIGSTLLHGWYEAAIFTRTTLAGQTTLDIDNLREMGQTRTLTLQGLGVGSWFYAGDGAQGHTDAMGRRNTRADAVATRRARLRELRAEHGSEWTYEQYADAVAVSLRTVKDDFSAVREEETSRTKDVASEAELS